MQTIYFCPANSQPKPVLKIASLGRNQEDPAFIKYMKCIEVCHVKVKTAHWQPNKQACGYPKHKKQLQFGIHFQFSINLFTAIRLEAHKSTPIHKDQKEEASVIKKLINPKSKKKKKNGKSRVCGPQHQTFVFWRNQNCYILYTFTFTLTLASSTSHHGETTELHTRKCLKKD